MSSALTEYTVSSACIPIALCCRGGGSDVGEMFVSCDSKIYADRALHRQVETTTKVGIISDSDKREMYDRFQSWAVQNYGDSGKTKTVTRKKYQRIVRTLTGEDYCSGENSKFRFWVKGKGFRLGPIGCVGQNSLELYVPTKSVNDPDVMDAEKSFKKVAVVEDFFDIIYGVHVEMDGRGGRHAGQKRTYRAIAETYSFLPREAVTRFLMSCNDCQKRMHLTFETNNNTVSTSDLPLEENVIGDPALIDYTVPITQTYLNRMRSKAIECTDYFRDEDTLSSADSEMSRDRSVSPQLDDSIGSPKPEQDIPPVTEVSTTDSRINSPMNLSTPTKGSDVAGDDDKPMNMKSNRSTPNGRIVDRGLTSHPERKRRASDEISLDSSTTKASETGTIDDTKDDDDDDDNDEDEKMPPGFEYEPETLKAFNMFVRLFVDENLDRVVPISKQPKDKIQAILDACDRQFPVFRERSRKRIRTYLKSCRRMRRSKEQNGWEPLRPTPPHLTSAAAEGLLAQACENESQNAKRMRMGLEPLPASVMNQVSPVTNYIAQQSNSTSSAQLQHSPKQPAREVSTQNHSSGTPTPSQQTSPLERSLNSHDIIRQQPPTSATAAAAAAAAFRPPHEFQPPFFANGNGLFRPGFGSSYQTPAHHHPQVLAHTPLQHNNIQNGPTDLSLKKGSQKSQLSVSEVATIKQLIAGYRESAAFLYRSADELEQLLLQQN